MTSKERVRASFEHKTPDRIPCFLKGVSGLGPIQKVEGMQPEGLKADFGDKLCFHGGIDTQNMLPHGKPAEVKVEAERFIETMNQDGGTQPEF